MSDAQFDQKARLARIGYSGPLEPTLETLNQLIFAHANAIAYETLDVMLGRLPKLDLGTLQRKMIVNKRGGYCFEQNMLFRTGLQSLGYRRKLDPAISECFRRSGCGAAGRAGIPRTARAQRGFADRKSVQTRFRRRSGCADPLQGCVFRHCRQRQSMGLPAQDRAGGPRRRAVDIFSEDSLSNAYIRDGFRANDTEMPRRSILSFSMQLRFHLLARANFLTVLHGSVLAFKAKPWSLKILPIDLQIAPMPIAIFTLKNRTLGPVAQLFIEHAHKAAREMAGRFRGLGKY